MSKRKIEESAQMIARYDVNTGLKAQKYTFVVIDDNILQFINTHLGGSFARNLCYEAHNHFVPPWQVILEIRLDIQHRVPCSEVCLGQTNCV